MRLISLAAGAALFAVAACGGGGDAEAPKPMPKVELLAPEMAGDHVWAVDVTSSSVGFQGSMNGKTFDGGFSNFAIGIALDPANPSEGGAIEARIDLGSVDAGDSEKNDALPKETWFHIDAHPIATFRSDAIVATGEGSFAAEGTLSLKGITKDVTLPFTLDVDDATGRAVAESSVTLNRSDFQVGTGEFAEGKWVSFDVEVIIRIEADQRG
ncbi:MAG: YceI family protein [Parvularculaceae bacterium]|nr:YceI family protein [Parvularculaceae bacterium]